MGNIYLIDYNDYSVAPCAQPASFYIAIVGGRALLSSHASF